MEQLKQGLDYAGAVPQTLWNMGVSWLSLIPQGITGITELLRTGGDFESATNAINAVGGELAKKIQIHASESGDDLETVASGVYDWAKNNVTDGNVIGNAIIDSAFALLPFKAPIARGVKGVGKGVGKVTGKALDKFAYSETGQPATILKSAEGIPVETYLKTQTQHPNTPISRLTPEQISEAVTAADAAYPNPVTRVGKPPIADRLYQWGIDRLEKPVPPVVPPTGIPVPPVGTEPTPTEQAPVATPRTSKPVAAAPTTPYDIPFNTPKKTPKFSPNSLTNIIDSPYLRTLKIFGGENHPMVAELVRLETSSIMKRGQYQPLEREFETAWKKLPDKVKPQVHNALLHNDIPKATELLARSRAVKNTTKASELVTKIRSALDERFKETVDSGVPMEYREGFYPRKLMDPDGFIKELNKIIVEKRAGIPKEAVSGLNKVNARLTELTDEVRAGKLDWGKYQKEVDKLITGDVIKVIADPTTTHAKSRTLPSVPKRLQKFYASPDYALPEYFTDTARVIAERNFLGRNYDTVDVGISNKIASELARGTMSPEQAVEFKKVLQERFSPSANKGSSRVVKLAKNVGYMGTIANALSSVIQGLDTIPAAARYGLGNTLKSLFTDKKIKAKDLGLFEIAQEIEHSGGRGTAGWKPQVSERMLRNFINVAGFRAMDRFGKNTMLTAASFKNKRLASSAEGIAELERKGWRHIYRSPEEWKTFTEALKKRGNKDPIVQEAALFELLQVQPIALSNMPITWLRHPNGRIAYMLKTWAIRQLNTVREDMLRGNYGKASKFMSAMVASAMIAPHLKDTVANLMAMLGDKREVKERANDSWYNQLTAAVLRILLLGDKFSMGKALHGDPSKLAADLVVPAPVQMGFTMIGDAIKLLEGKADSFEDIKSKRYVPLVGTYYQRTEPK